MPSTFSSKLRLELQANGEGAGTWGTTTNTNLGTLLENSIAGTATIALPAGAGDYTLTAYNGVDDEARQAIIKITAALTANRNVICPSTSKQYLVYNATTGAFTVTLKTAAGTGVVIPQGAKTLLYCDGTNVVPAVDYIPTLNGAVLAQPSQLTGYHYPTLDGGFRDLYRSDWLPAGFNQQWGGAQWGNLPDGSFGSVATGNVQDDSVKILGDAAARTHLSSGFVQSETFSPPGVFVKAYKVGNPTDNLTWSARANSAGSPTGAVLFTALTKSGKEITSKTDGEWYYLSGTTTSLTAGTTYHESFSRSGAVDASNYYVIKATASNKYPGGYLNTGDGTPTWTPTTTAALCCVIPNPAANSLIQSGGMFDYKLAFNPGTPWNQSRSLAQPLTNFYDGKYCTVLHRGTYAVSTNVWDFGYGLDHDRITLTINASGYPVLSIYRSDRTLAQVTGAGSVTSGNHDVAIRVRTVGDGADVAYLYVDGVSVGTPLTAQTFTMDVNMKLLGTARLGDGFGIIPAWTLDQQMTGGALSTQGWTSTVSLVTEANAYLISGGNLYQIKSAFEAAGAASYAYYSRNPSFVNATGWAVAIKLRVPFNDNTPSTNCSSFRGGDNVAQVTVSVHEYFLEVSSTGAPDFTLQGDFKSQSNVFVLQGKGADYYLFMNGKLICDGTGKLAGGASNLVLFGDTVAGTANSDAIWSYVKYYNGGMLLPIATTGTCSEFAHWSGDKSAILPYAWNAGTPVSIKQLCGVEKNYIDGRDAGVQREVRRGVTANPTATAEALLTDLECYVIGSSVYEAVKDYPSMTITNAAGQLVAYVDGVVKDTSTYYSPVGSQNVPITVNAQAYTMLGLHKVDARFAGYSGGTNTSVLSRNIIVEARS